jgi:hypothetical protein
MVAERLEREIAEMSFLGKKKLSATKHDLKLGGF